MDQLGSCEDDYFRRNDRFGMHFSMEGRFPWASKRLMNYCMNINPEIKLKAGQKGIVRSAYSDLLPGYILDKQKTGWSAPVQEWFKLKKSWPLRQSLKYCADEGVSGLNLLMFRHFLSKIT
jgi:asparagine synthase (glutamine-hydrolysing)